MTDTVRCPACRGAKKVPKLGGMIGQCNTCSGKGTILAVDKPKPVEIAPEYVCSNELINAVADSVPASTVEIVDTEPAIKVDGKKAIYKRKRAS
jgi:hypothetical protein